jgi:hypothetical protein
MGVFILFSEAASGEGKPPKLRRVRSAITVRMGEQEREHAEFMAGLQASVGQILGIV